MLMTYDRTDPSPRGSPSNYSATLPASPLTSPTPHTPPPTNNTNTCSSPLIRRQGSLESHRLHSTNYTDTSFTMDRRSSPIGNDSIDGVTTSPFNTLPKRELKQLKKFERELLVNKSPTIHIKRKAEYIDIDLPDTTSDDNSSIDSANSYIYDIPTNRQSHYDVPTPIKEQEQLTYDIPRTQTLNRSPSTSTSNLSNPSLRPLPHLPTDYVNVVPAGARTLPAPSSKNTAPPGGGYVNIGYHPQKPIIEKTEMGMYVDVNLEEKLSQSRSTSSLYKDMPERIESQLTLRRVESDRPSIGTTSTTATTTNSHSGSPSPTPVSKTAKELAEEGYEFINPATMPALLSPPICTPSTSSIDTVEEEDEDDEYITVTRQSSMLPTLIKAPVDKKGSSDSDAEFIQVRSRSKRLSDGYEEIQEVIKELKANKDGQLTTPVPAANRSLSDSEITSKTDTAVEKIVDDSKDSPLPPVFSSNSSTPLPLSRQASTESEHNKTLEGSTTMETLLTTTASDEPDMSFSRESTHSPDEVSNNKVIINSEVEEYRPHLCATGCHDDQDDFEEVSINSSLETVDDQNKARSTSDPPTHNDTCAVNISRNSILVPTVLGSPVENEHNQLIRKRSSTLGDILDTKEPKKHTYVNVPDDAHTPLRTGSMKALANEVPNKKKPPKPLPRPPSLRNNLPRQSSATVVDPCSNGNNSNNKVKELVRQFSDC